MNSQKKLVILCFFALSLQVLHAQDTEKKPVPGLSDSKLTEFSPTISADGKTIVFESSIDEETGWQLFQSQLENGAWSKPVPLEAINKKCQFIAGPSLSFDGNQLYYTAFIEGTSKSEDIYYSDRTGENTWSEPISIGLPINTDESYEGFPSISPDGKSLYFIRVNTEHNTDKKSKETCFVIYVSKKTPDGKWGEPVALPAPINTGCERDPKIMADNRTLIFSSIREGGLGKYDMYQTTLQNDGTWSAPVFLDFINSKDNDQSPCISASGDMMFYYTKNDIYAVPIPTKYQQMVNAVISGRVLEEKTLKNVSAKIFVTNLNTRESFVATNNEADGEYSVVLGAGSKYTIVFDNDKLFPDTLNVDLENQKTYLIQRKNILLKSSCTPQITLIDKDLKIKINAWLTVQQEATYLINDSARVSTMPIHVRFNAPLDYKILAMKEKYTPYETIWSFKEQRKTANKNIVVPIEHVKTEFVANVISWATKKKMTVKVYANDKTVDETIIAQAGEKMLLRKGDRYQIITGSEEGYFFATQEIVAGETTTIDLFLVRIEVGGKLSLNNITFEKGSAILKSSSLFELDRIVELMKANPKLAIEVSAHTDDSGDDNFNLKLSDKRALSAYQYLMSKGVQKERMQPKGYGESKPLVANDTDENKALNRRVELLVLSI